MLDRTPVIDTPAVCLAAESRTIGDLFVERVQRDGSRIAFQQREHGQWIPTSWQHFHDRSAAIASMLVGLGLKVGDKICIVGSTRPEWCYADIAGHLAGLVTLGHTRP